MNLIENINELNENLKPFPEAENIFSEKQPWLKDHFLPLISINLAEINPEWKDTILHMISPFEPYDSYIGDGTEEHHNEFTTPNWLAFRLTEDNKYEFLGKEGFFLRTAINNWDFNSEEEKDFQKMKENLEKSKENVAKFGHLVNLRYPEYKGKLNIMNFLDDLGGGFWYGNWTSSAEEEGIPSAFEITVKDFLGDDELPNDGIEITYQGNPFYYIGNVAGYNYCGSGADAIILMYEPVSRIVLFTFDYS
ncbi:hypothetical protein [Capnocytophaga cynodegmi]|uniref:hypothetical protein n=1 Tax=Capnocytophaga cynodegmi TaxID=28189 RepID=UPI00385F55E8